MPRPPMPPSLLSGTGQALSKIATQRNLPSHLRRAGGPQRVRSATSKGIDPLDAVLATAKITKGQTAELAQSVDFTVMAALMGHAERARPSPSPSNPLTDLEILRGTRVASDGLRQLKVGTAAYVRPAIDAGRYQAAGVDLVVNVEALKALADAGHDVPTTVADRVRYGAAQARPLRADESLEQAKNGLTRSLTRQTTLTKVELLVESVRAGTDDGLFAFIFGLGQSLVARRPARDGWEPVLADALAGAARAHARTTLQTAFVLFRFDASARAAYSAGLVRRIARGTIVAGAVAEVIVESVIDMVRLMRGEITRDDFLKKFVVHTTTAVGAASGALLAQALFAGTTWWLQGILMLLGGLGGGVAGRRLGERIVGDQSSP